MAQDVYKQHDAAFYHVSAYIVAKDGACLAKIAFKHPRDGAGRLYAYVHWLGVPMVRGFASGYDKRSAAVANAVKKMTMNARFDALSPEMDLQVGFLRTLERDGGEYFDRKLELAGFTVWQAV